MAKIQIHRATNGEQDLPIFNEIAQRMDAVREKAFELFLRRGAETGHDLDDWVSAEQEVLGWPAAELKERNGEYEVDVTLPGFTDKEIEVTATPSELIVHAATRHEASGGDESIVWSEFKSNDVYRRFPFPTSVDAKRVSAQLENGMLKVVAPKAEPAAPEAAAAAS